MAPLSILPMTEIIPGPFLLTLLLVLSVTQMLTTQADRFSSEEVDPPLPVYSCVCPATADVNLCFPCCSDGADVHCLSPRCGWEPGLQEPGSHNHSRRGKRPGVMWIWIFPPLQLQKERGSVFIFLYFFGAVKGDPSWKLVYFCWLHSLRTDLPPQHKRIRAEVPPPGLTNGNGPLQSTSTAHPLIFSTAEASFVHPKPPQSEHVA